MALRGRSLLLIVDEAQNMPDETIEELRLLSNLETEKEKLLQIILMGQPELREILAEPAHEALRRGSRLLVTAPAGLLLVLAYAAWLVRLARTAESTRARRHLRLQDGVRHRWRTARASRLPVAAYHAVRCRLLSLARNLRRT